MTPTHSAFLDAIRADGIAAADGARPAAGDWRGLSARLAAAHALRRLMQGEQAEPHSHAASFAPVVARALTRGPAVAGLSRDRSACDSVNRFASSDGKPDGGKDVALAGIQSPAIEG